MDFDEILERNTRMLRIVRSSENIEGEIIPLDMKLEENFTSKWEWEVMNPSGHFESFVNKMKLLFGGFYITIQLTELKVKLQICVRKSHTVLDLKKEVKKNMGVNDIAHQILIFNGKILCNEKSLKECQIEEGSIIEMGMRYYGN